MSAKSLECKIEYSDSREAILIKIFIMLFFIFCSIMYLIMFNMEVLIKSRDRPVTARISNNSAGEKKISNCHRIIYPKAVI